MKHHLAQNPNVSIVTYEKPQQRVFHPPLAHPEQQRDNTSILKNIK
jgi:hypothetical protein